MTNSCANNASTFIEPFDYTIDAQGNVRSGNRTVGAAGEIELTGTMEFCPQIAMDVQWGFLSLNSASMLVNFGEHATMTTLGQMSATIGAKADLLKLTQVPPTTLIIGGVPVVLQLQAVVYTGASLTAKAAFYASAEQDAQASAGLTYANGTTTPVQSATTAFAINGASDDGTIDGKIVFGVKAGVLLYGSLLPNVATDVYVGGASGPPEVINLGLEANVGFDASILGIPNTSVSLSSPELDLFHIPLWTGTGSFSPTLQSVVPNAADAGASDLTITVAGSNFVPDSVARFNGADLATTFTNPGGLTATIPAADLMSAGSFPITVTNPDTAGAVSNALTFTVNGVPVNPLPSISSLSPSSVVVGAPPQVLNIYGSGFLPTSTVMLNSIAHAATYVGAGQISIHLTSPDLAVAGSYPVRVSNPTPGGGTSAAAAFTVTSPGVQGWTWMGGSNLVNQPTVYGVKGIPGTNNIPGGRTESVGWIGGGGAFWLFGGGDASHQYNDLWRYDPSTVQWTWVSGGSAADAPGVYGTQGVAGTSNYPGGRSMSTGWTDSAGKLWVFGGLGYDSAGSNSYLNDLWKFDPVNGSWTWVSGPG